MEYAATQDPLIVHDGDQDWTMEIKPRNSWLYIPVKELWQYRDLLWLFVKRDFVSVYKQTVLGPLWFVIQPVLTTFMFTFIFSRTAKIGTGGMPPMLFYVSGLTLWNYFSVCLTKTSTTFTANASIFGKVYFPRLIVPFSIVISNLISFFIQMGLVLATMIYFYLKGQFTPQVNAALLLLPVFILMLALLGLGLGIIVSALTTRYRDLAYLVGFSVQLLMYATPIIYPLSSATGLTRTILSYNPITHIVEAFKYGLLGSGELSAAGLFYSAVFTLVSLIGGIFIFNSVEKSFMDVV